MQPRSLNSCKRRIKRKRARRKSTPDFLDALISEAVQGMPNLAPETLPHFSPSELRGFKSGNNSSTPFAKLSIKPDTTLSSLLVDTKVELMSTAAFNCEVSTSTTPKNSDIFRARFLKAMKCYESHDNYAAWMNSFVFRLVFEAFNVNPTVEHAIKYYCAYCDVDMQVFFKAACYAMNPSFCEKEDGEQYLEEVCRLAEQDDIYAQALLCLIYLDGTEVMPQDRGKLLDLLPRLMDNLEKLSTMSPAQLRKQGQNVHDKDEQKTDLSDASNAYDKAYHAGLEDSFYKEHAHDDAAHAGLDEALEEGARDEAQEDMLIEASNDDKDAFEAKMKAQRQAEASTPDFIELHKQAQEITDSSQDMAGLNMKEPVSEFTSNQAVSNGNVAITSFGMSGYSANSVSDDSASGFGDEDLTELNRDTDRLRSNFALTVEELAVDPDEKHPSDISIESEDVSTAKDSGEASLDSAIHAPSPELESPPVDLSLESNHDEALLSDEDYKSIGNPPESLTELNTDDAMDNESEEVLEEDEESDEEKSLAEDNDSSEFATKFKSHDDDASADDSSDASAMADGDKASDGDDISDDDESDDEDEFDDESDEDDESDDDDADESDDADEKAPLPNYHMLMLEHLLEGTGDGCKLIQQNAEMSSQIDLSIIPDYSGYTAPHKGASEAELATIKPLTRGLMDAYFIGRIFGEKLLDGSPSFHADRTMGSKWQDIDADPELIQKIIEFGSKHRALACCLPLYTLKEFFGYLKIARDSDEHSFRDLNQVFADFKRFEKWDLRFSSEFVAAFLNLYAKDFGKFELSDEDPIKLLKKGAYKNESDCALTLASFYLIGYKVKQDFKLAKSFFQKAQSKTEVNGNIYVSMMMAEGLLKSSNINEVKNLVEKSSGDLIVPFLVEVDLKKNNLEIDDLEIKGLANEHYSYLPLYEVLSKEKYFTRVENLLKRADSMMDYKNKMARYLEPLINGDLELRRRWMRFYRRDSLANPCDD